MSKITVLFLLLAVSATALSGCIGGDDAPATEDDEIPVEADDVAVTDTTGSLRGTVSSDLFEPLGGALVSVVEAERETTVSRSGEFTVNDLDPGRYTLHIQALGYEAATRAANVAAGEVTEVTVQLVPLPSNEPWVDYREYVGKIGWAAAWQVELAPVGCYIGPEAPLITPKSCGGLRSGDSTNGEVKLNATDDSKTLVVEMVWDPAGPLGEFLQLDFMCPEVPRDGNGGAVLDTEHVCYFDTPGRQSPLVHRVDEEHWLENGYNHTGDWAARVFATHGMLGTYELTGVDVGVAYEQTFRLYTSVFHKEGAPEGYSGIPDQ